MYGRRKNGSEFPVEISLAPVEMEDGILVASAIRDITDRKRAEAQRTRLIREHAARSEAEAASRAKEEFLAILSHELRNPLNAVLNAVAVLDEIGVQDPSAIKARLFAASLNGSQGCVMIFWTWPDCRLEGRPRDSAP